jgi:hypothetical protein
MDLSRRRLDVCLVDDAGELVAQLAAAPDADGLCHLARRVAATRVRAVIESMNGARFVHDTLEQLGWGVDRGRAEGQGASAVGVQDRQERRRVLAVLSQRDLVPAIWLPDQTIRRERELARFGCIWSGLSDVLCGVGVTDRPVWAGKALHGESEEVGDGSATAGGHFSGARRRGAP